MKTDTLEALPESKLVKSQKRTYRKELDGGIAWIGATVRYDDQCGNGHNSFSITGRTSDGSGGCIHEEIAKHFPELAPFIKWHLFDSTGPMHYLANTIYHAEEHGPTHAFVYYTGPSDPLNISGTKERLLGYEKAEKARTVEGVEGYRVAWDEKTAKVRNLAHARSSAVWPEATDEQLCAPPAELKAMLLERLPALVAEFKRDVESLGFVY